jgi:transposase
VLITWFRGLDRPVTRIGLEAGPLSQWLYAGLREAGFAVELLETRQVADAFRAMPVKTDRKDARGIAQLLRLGWFKPVHCKSLGAQEARALLTARRQVQAKRHEIEMSIRGIFFRRFGLKVGRTRPKTFEHRVRELVDGHSTLSTVVNALGLGHGSIGHLRDVMT